MKGLRCNRPDCDAPIIFAVRPNGSRLPYDASDLEPFSDAATGAHVVVAGKGWRPADLIEDFMVRFEIAEAQARRLVEGYPWHRPHIHERVDTETEVAFP